MCICYIHKQQIIYNIKRSNNNIKNKTSIDFLFSSNSVKLSRELWRLKRVITSVRRKAGFLHRKRIPLGSKERGISSGLNR